jgi:GNAT superfamily N-acetyltransferase
VTDGEFSLRPAGEGDGKALTELAVAAADTGAIRVAPRYLHDPIETTRVMQPEAQWVLAESDEGVVVGAGSIDFDEIELEGEAHRCARFNGVMVHPDFRRRGIATALTQWRLERAGPDAVVTAMIQSGNEGSFANARKWATQIFGTMLLPVFKAGPHAGRGGLDLREPSDDDEWQQAVDGLAAFERGWNFRVPETAASTRERLARTPLAEPVQRLIVALEGDRVVGGCELHDNTRLATLVIEHVPAVLRAVDLVARILPADRVLRTVIVSRLWYAPDRVDVGRALWAFARSEAGKTGNTLGITIDPRGPLRPLVPLRPWTAKGKLSVAVRSPVELSEERLLASA